MTTNNIRIEVLFDQSICKWKVYNFDQDDKWIYSDTHPTQQDAVIDALCQHFKLLDNGCENSVKCFEKSYAKFELSSSHAWYKQAEDLYETRKTKGSS